MIYSKPNLLESSDFERTYPYLARSSKHNYVVLFVAENAGTVVDTAEHKEVSLGEIGGAVIGEASYEGFTEANFVPLQQGETVTLSNFPIEQ